MTLLIRGGQILDPGRFQGQGDVLIENGIIQSVGPDLLKKRKDSNGLDILDAKGLVVVPGFVDLHVHLREPGFEYKETIATGSASAVAGGFTSICCMPNTNPVNDNQSVTQFILSKAALAKKARVFPIGAITKGSEGKELAEIGELSERRLCRHF